MLKGTAVELLQMLDCREEREYTQRMLRQQYNCAILSFTMNIPGPIKTNPEILSAFNKGKMEIFTALEQVEAEVLEILEHHAVTGDELLIAMNHQNLDRVKTAMMAIEEGSVVGRLFDIDLLDQEGNKLSRSTFRKCLICERQAQDCARSRRHTIEEMQRVIGEIMQNAEITQGKL